MRPAAAASMRAFVATLVFVLAPAAWHSARGQPSSQHAAAAVAANAANNSHSAAFNYDAPDDCAWKLRSDHGDEVLLACTLRTINSEMDTTNFSAIPSEHTVSLLISCDPAVAARSSLQNQSFAHLVRLRELELDACRLATWPAATLYGLDDLRNLTVRTGLYDAVDDAGGSTDAMVLDADSFARATRLERLDLSTNNMAAVPDRAFCRLPNLVHLNLSRNRVRDVHDLGFKERAPPPPPQPLISSRDDVYDVDPAAYLQQQQQLQHQQQQQQQQHHHQDQQHQYQQQHRRGGGAASAAPCPLDLQTLDVSWNRIAALPTAGFGSLRRLAELRLAGNGIALVHDRPLAGLAGLEVLDVSCNAIGALPVDMFKDVADTVRQIYAQNNSLAALPPGLFVNLYQLTTLDLSYNRLTSDWVDAGTFTGLIRLVTLNLSNNRITRLDPTVFHDLYTLQILYLGGNQIETVPDDAFIPLRNLDTLILSNNRIVDLGPLALNGLHALTLLSLDGNRLADVRDGCLTNCTTLQELNLSGNRLRAVPAALREMRLLKTLDLGENRIETVDPDSFYGMSNLYGLRLIGNRVRNLTSNLFDHLGSLQILNVAHNQIDYVAPDAFHNMPSIQAIRLDGNRLSTIEHLFRNVSSLLWLNVSDNVLNDFDYGMLPERLEWLDVHKNYLTELSNRDGVTVRVRTLDARFNYLTYVGPASVPDAVEYLLLNDNQIMTVEPGTFLRKTNVTRVDLYANHIGQLDINALRLAPVPPGRAMPEFYVGGNPFQCDCKMEWLQRVNELAAMLRQYPTVMDMPAVYCKLLYNRENRYVPMADIQPAQFVCAYKTHCFAVCQCCEFDACDCEMTCPVNCTCYHDQPWSSNIVDCYSSNYTQLPAKIPMDATEVYLDGNVFTHLSSHALLGRKNLRILFANSSGIRSVRNDTFTGLKQLAVLHLEHNRIERLDGSEFDTVENLRELYLQHNSIRHISNTTFEPLASLQVLRLDHNRLRDYDAWTLAGNARLTRVHLSRNPWTCDCGFVQSLRRYLTTAAAAGGGAQRVVDAADVTCRAADGPDAAAAGAEHAAVAIRDRNATECAAGSFFGSIVENRLVRDALPAALTAACALLAVALAAYLLAAYRHECRAWVYHKCGLRMCHKTVPCRGGDGAAGADDDDDDDDDDHRDGGRVYDAYVAYSLKDDGFVAQMLAPGLEQTAPRYRVGLHYRDFNATAYVADTIAEAIGSSKRTVLVVSKNFLESEWCRFEFKSALREGLRDGRQRGRLIVVALGEIRPADVDPELRAHLQSAVRVGWGDRMFWEKLRFAMPDVGKCRGGGGGGGGGTASRSRNGSSNVYATPLRASYTFAPAGRGRGAQQQPPLPSLPATAAGPVPSGKYYLSPAYVDSSQHLWA